MNIFEQKLNCLICVHEYIHFGHLKPLGLQKFPIHVNKLCCSNVSILKSQRISDTQILWDYKNFPFM